ncbi:MAG: hypothetical protein QOJ13_85 [Gaiellales bacterium]|jgi:hypothetical protein|nr:hypothetical protein [Gaiellales bacterium]
MYELILAIVVQVAVVGVLFRWAVLKQRRLKSEFEFGGRATNGRS